jgi:hypothetical protein
LALLQRWNGTSWVNVEEQTYNIACGEQKNHQFSNIGKYNTYMHFWIDVWHLGTSLSNPPEYRGQIVTPNWIR